MTVQPTSRFDVQATHLFSHAYAATPQLQSKPQLNHIPTSLGAVSDGNLAVAMTQGASRQTYLTIRYLVDRPLVRAAYNAYAYFRWLDDRVDQINLTKRELFAFLARQKVIITNCRQGNRLEGLCSEERLLADLIIQNDVTNCGLQMYVDYMMAVMVFDAHRKGYFVSEAALTQYTGWLAMAVTEALHYFVGHNQAAPQDERRYLAVTAAHITHMLRDTVEDTAVGYYNIPLEYLQDHRLRPTDITHEAYRAWVQGRVQLARDYFAASKTYLAEVGNLRCRLAGYAYIGRFEIVLDAIERDNYYLRSDYPERKSRQAQGKVVLSALRQMIGSLRPGKTF